MTTSPLRGEVWRADPGGRRGSEQQGVRPVVIIQNDVVNRGGNTVLVVPFTSNTNRAALPSALLVPAGTGGLSVDSVALCHQLCVLDKTGLLNKLGTLPAEILEAIESKLRFTLAL